MWVTHVDPSASSLESSRDTWRHFGWSGGKILAAIFYYYPRSCFSKVRHARWRSSYRSETRDPTLVKCWSSSRRRDFWRCGGPHNANQDGLIIGQLFPKETHHIRLIKAITFLSILLQVSHRRQRQLSILLGQIDSRSHSPIVTCGLREH